MRCHYHAEDEAIGACAICGHPLCESCTVERDRVFYCASCLEEKDEATSTGGSIPKIEVPRGEYEYARPPGSDAQPATPPEASRKHPGAATMFSILLPFTGQIYNGQFAKALTFLLLFISCIILATKSRPMEGVFWMLTVFIYFYQIYDAWKTARSLREEDPGQALVPVVDGGSDTAFQDPTANGQTDTAVVAGESPIWGISLILLGIAFLLDNFDLVRIESVFRLWPLFVVVTGLMMILSWMRRDAA